MNDPRLPTLGEVLDDVSRFERFRELDTVTVHSRDRDGRTPLHAMRFDESAVRVLVQNGADIDAVDHKGNTTLHVAVQRGHFRTVATLLELGADRSIRNRKRKTAHELALERSDQTCAGVFEGRMPRVAEPPTMLTLRFVDADGGACSGSIFVWPLGSGRSKVEMMVGWVPGLAWSDVFEVDDSGAFRAIERAGYLTVRLLLPGPVASVEMFERIQCGLSVSMSESTEIILTVPPAARGAVIQEALAQFSKLHPGVSVEYGDPGGAAGFELLPHPTHPRHALRRVTMELRRADAAQLHLRWHIEGAQSLVVPALEPDRARADGLWKTTCLEVFAQAVDGGAAYVELNLSPSGRWNAYDFTGRREGMAVRAVAAVPEATMVVSDDGVAVFDVVVPRAALPAGPCRLGVTAVLEEHGGVKSYWALVHPSDDAPDFHDPAGFIARLEALPSHP